MTNEIFPCLWFDGQAKEAAKFYCSIFKSSKITFESNLVVNFELNGRKYMGLNGGSNFKFNESISFVVPCDTQEEIDYYWDGLLADGGTESQCGWLKDKFGLSWQIVPNIIGELMNDPKKGERVMGELMKMVKIDIETLKNA